MVGRTVYGDGDAFTPPVTVGDEPLDPDGVRPSRAPTESVTEYDIRRRPIRMRTLREPTSTADPSAPPTREGRPLSAVSTVVDQRLRWDPANNLLSQIDDRPGVEWPAGRRPQTVHVRHDALYRVVGAEYDYTEDTGARTVADDATDWRDEMARTKPNDPMETEPAPMVPSCARKARTFLRTIASPSV